MEDFRPTDEMRTAISAGFLRWCISLVRGALHPVAELGHVLGTARRQHWWHRDPDRRCLLRQLVKKAGQAITARTASGHRSNEAGRSAGKLIVAAKPV